MENFTKEQIQAVYVRQYGFSVEHSEAVAIFLLEELKLFDKSLEGLLEEFPQLGSHIENSRLRIVAPHLAAVEYMHTQLVTEEMVVRTKEGKFGEIDKLPKDFPDNSVKESKHFLKLRAELLKEAKENLPKYIDFCESLFGAIKKKRSERRIITFDDYQMKDMEVRNEIYRGVLPKDKKWLLGYHLKLSARTSQAVALENEFNKKLFDSLDEEGKRMLASNDVLVMFPQPYGPEVMNNREMYEKFWEALGTPNENGAFKKRIYNFFKKRAKKIHNK